MRATAVAPTTGGMVSSVWEVRFDRSPGRAALKVSKDPQAFTGEKRGLEYFRRHTAFPSPEPYFLWRAPAGAGNGAEWRSVLALEWIPGMPLGEVPVSPEQRLRLDEQIARHVCELHAHTRSLFGAVEGEPTSRRWVDIFGPRLAEMVAECAGRTEPRTIAVGRAVLERLEEILGAHATPACLVHGDLWANNILVDPDAPGGIAVKGYIDPGAEYADPESELAYLEGFRTVGPRFLEIYRERYPMDAGYPLRRTVYHYHTMLVHIWYFGDAHYHRRASALAEQLEAALDGRNGECLASS